jgi:DNA-binding transcriptional regulator YiaG
LGIAQRTIHVSRSHIATRRHARKAFPTTLKTLGDHIHAARFEKGLLLSQMAEKLGVPYEFVTRWEQDLEKPSITEWENISRLLGLANHVISNTPKQD